MLRSRILAFLLVLVGGATLAAAKDFALISKDFTTDNGMLTPSLKLKRRKVMEEYGKLLDSLYGNKAKSSEKRASAA